VVGFTVGNIGIFFKVILDLTFYKAGAKVLNLGEVDVIENG
jgi:hypothetical protein